MHTISIFQVDSISQTMGIMGYGLENLEKYKMGFGKIQKFSGGESPQTPLLLHTIVWSLLVDCPPPPPHGQILKKGPAKQRMLVSVCMVYVNVIILKTFKFRNQIN